MLYMLIIQLTVDKIIANWTHDLHRLVVFRGWGGGGLL